MLRKFICALLLVLISMTVVISQDNNQDSENNIIILTGVDAINMHARLSNKSYDEAAADFDSFTLENSRQSPFSQGLQTNAVGGFFASFSPQCNFEDHLAAVGIFTAAPGSVKAQFHGNRTWAFAYEYATDFTQFMVIGHLTQPYDTIWLYSVTASSAVNNYNYCTDQPPIA